MYKLSNLEKKNCKYTIEMLKHFGNTKNWTYKELDMLKVFRDKIKSRRTCLKMQKMQKSKSKMFCKCKKNTLKKQNLETVKHI